ncbi:ABC-type dipeptide/oligopeptide/nickel transport system permease component [Bradyrhizobium sp. GM22.5]
MLAYIARRIVYVIPIVISVALVCFLLVHITPGDPLVAVLPADASQELAAQLRTAYGFDRPLPVQFGLWLLRALHGDLGNSIATGRPVLAEVMRAVSNTVTLAIAAAIIGFTMGILLGLIAGYFRETWIDKLATSFAIAGVSVPHYWLGMVLVIIFSVQLNWLPAVGAGPGRLGRLGLGLGAFAISRAASDHDLGDPDGHRHSHGARADRRHSQPGLRRGAACKRPA